MWFFFFFFMHFLTFNFLLPWKLPHLGQGYHWETNGDERSALPKARRLSPHSPIAILSIVYHKKNTPFNRSSRSHASNDWNSLMLYYEQMIIVLWRWRGNIIKQESKTKTRKQPVSKVIQADSILSRPYECGTKGLWSGSNAIHGCHGSFHWDY